MLLQKGLVPLSCDNSVLSILDFKELQLLLYGKRQTSRIVVVSEFPWHVPHLHQWIQFYAAGA